MGLEKLRKKIDSLDEQIVKLLSDRAEVVVEVGKFKNAQKTPIYAPDREHQILERIQQLNSGPLSNRCLVAIYRELMSGSFSLERQLRVGCLGPEGSFSHVAATGKFGASAEYLPLPDIRSVFDHVARGHIEVGVVPIENSIGGGVIDTLDAFLETPVQICAEIRLAVHHNLLANCPLEKVERVYSRPEVFAQCRNWLSGTFAHVEIIPVASSAKAAELAVKEANAAAIASRLAAELHELNILCENIEDYANNETRFLIISQNRAKPTGNDKTSLFMTTAHKPGALVAALDAFRQNDVNLTYIDSRPNKKQNWEYNFFIDAEGHVEQPAMKAALAAAKEHTTQLLLLGSYPQAVDVLEQKNKNEKIKYQNSKSKERSIFRRPYHSAFCMFDIFTVLTSLLVKLKGGLWVVNYL